MCQKWGIRNWAGAAVTRVFFASGTGAECETKVMRSPLITTMESGCTEAVPGLMTVTWEMTICLGGGVVCAKVAEASESASEISSTIRWDGEIMPERLPPKSLRSKRSNEQIA